MKKNNFGNRSGLSIMKKILMICLITMLTYCSNTGTLSPPSWIIGTWSNSNGLVNSVFSSDNIVYTIASTTIDVKKNYLNNENADVTYTVTDMSTDTSYTVDVITEKKNSESTTLQLELC